MLSKKTNMVPVKRGSKRSAYVAELEGRLEETKRELDRANSKITVLQETLQGMANNKVPAAKRQKVSEKKKEKKESSQMMDEEAKEEEGNVSKKSKPRYKPTKPKGYPRLARGAFQCYLKKWRSLNEASIINSTFPQIRKRAEKEWKSLSEDEQKKWTAKEAADQERFEADLAKFKATSDEAAQTCDAYAEAMRAYKARARQQSAE